MFNINLLLFQTRSLPYKAGIVVGVSICTTHWILIMPTTVNFTRTPANNKKVYLFEKKKKLKKPKKKQKQEWAFLF